MKKMSILLLSVLVFNQIAFSQKQVELIKETEQSKVVVQLNSYGIIEKISGKLGELSESPLVITQTGKDTIKIKSACNLQCFAKQCYYLDIIKKSNSLEYKGYVYKAKEVIAKRIVFGKGNTIVKDDAISIIREEDAVKSIFDNPAYSILPQILYKDNVVNHVFTNDLNDATFKYKYKGKNQEGKEIVDFYEIRPGDNFAYFMTAAVANIKSKDKYVNLINYMIIECYNELMGPMMFPLLVDDVQQSAYLHDVTITADSYLREGRIKYLPENLNTTEIKKPWVEGKQGPGIGSKIHIQSKTKISKLIISNGFVSTKIQTYFNNNRVKDIKITDKASGKTQKVSLADSSDPVTIRLNFRAKELEIEILSVYKGQKYDDTCLNYILCQ